MGVATSGSIGRVPSWGIPFNFPDLRSNRLLAGLHRSDMPKRNFSWENKRVLVTGACGFIGSHLAERLAAAGARVRAMVFYHPQGSWGWLDSLPGETLATLEVVPGDVRDAQAMRQAVKGMDAVFHLAALIGIPYSYHAPESYVDTNVKGTLNVLLASRDHGTPRLLVTSTSEVYGTAKFVPIDESHPLQGQSPYSATKIGADRLAESFFRSFNLPVTTVRPFNTYGPRQSSRAVIPTIITQLLAGHREIRLGSLEPTRDFVYVKDTVEGFVRIAESETALGEEINIATGKEISVGELAGELIRQINPKARIVCEKRRVRPENGEVERLCGSNDKIHRLTGWKPRTSLEKGLAETIRWFAGNSNGNGRKAHLYHI